MPNDGKKWMCDLCHGYFSNPHVENLIAEFIKVCSACWLDITNVLYKEGRPIEITTCRKFVISDLPTVSDLILAQIKYEDHISDKGEDS